jgi:hypothetical protein
MMHTRADFAEWITYEPGTGLFYFIKPGQGRRLARPVGTKHSDGYVSIRLAGKHYLAHRVAWLMYYGAWPEGIIDHINRDKSDNRINNLRDVDGTINVLNQATRDDRNLPRGIDKKNGKYRVRLQVRGVRRERKGIATRAEAEAVWTAWFNEVMQC